MKEAQEHLPAGRVKRENSEAGDNAARPAAVDVFHSAPVAAFSIAGGSDEMDSRPKAALFVIHDDDAAARQGRDVSGAAAQGPRCRRRRRYPEAESFFRFPPPSGC